MHFRITQEEKEMLDYICQQKNSSYSEELMAYVEREYMCMLHTKCAT